MKAEFETITPDIARELLNATLSLNRKVSRKSVRRFAEAMTEGRWQSNGEPIILDVHGNVIDGQHRLLAIVESGKAQQILVVRGAEPSAFKTIDSGRSRQPADLLHIKGHSHALRVGSIVAAVYTFRQLGCFPTFGRPARSDLTHRNSAFDVVAEAAALGPLLTEAVDCSLRWARCGRFDVSPSLIGALFVLFAEKDRVEAASFFRRLIEMDFAGDGEPLRLLYQTITNKVRLAPLKHDCRQMSAIFIKAWNSMREGTTPRFLRLSSQDGYPEIR